MSQIADSSSLDMSLSSPPPNEREVCSLITRGRDVQRNNTGYLQSAKWANGEGPTTAVGGNSEHERSDHRDPMMKGEGEQGTGTIEKARQGARSEIVLDLSESG